MFRKKRPDPMQSLMQCLSWLVPGVFALAAIVLLLKSPRQGGPTGPVLFSIGSLRGKATQPTQQQSQPAAVASPAVVTPVPSPSPSPSPSPKPDPTVPVTLFIMSQCPDAVFCVAAFDRILRPLITAQPPLVNIRTEYIATIPAGDAPVQCMHGDGECAGNTQQLCLQTKAPSSLAWPSLVCHMASGPSPDLGPLRTCMHNNTLTSAMQHLVLACAGSGEGKKLARESAEVVAASKVVKSCTVFIAGKKRCIRDGGRWYDCEGGDSDAAFAQTICDAYKANGGTAPPQACPAA